MRASLRNMATTFSSAASAGSITLIATRSSVLTLQPSNTSPMPPRARKRFTSKIWLRTSPTLIGLARFDRHDGGGRSGARGRPRSARRGGRRFGGSGLGRRRLRCGRRGGGSRLGRRHLGRRRFGRRLGLGRAASAAGSARAPVARAPAAPPRRPVQARAPPRRFPGRAGLARDRRAFAGSAGSGSVPRRRHGPAARRHEHRALLFFLGGFLSLSSLMLSPIRK